LLPMFEFFRRRKAEPTEFLGTPCQWCRTRIPAEDEQGLSLVGAVFEPATGWFCSTHCADEYRQRFHLDSGRHP
jgi:hypothetical protein